MAGRSFATLILILTCCIAYGQKPDFRVLAFHGYGHEKFISFLTELSGEMNFTLESTADLSRMNSGVLKNYNVVIWINAHPDEKPQRMAFQKYIEGGGGWIGFGNVRLSENIVHWPWFDTFIGTLGLGGHRNSPTLPTRVLVDDTSHPVVQNIPSFMTTSPNSWAKWEPSPRKNKDIKVLLTLDPLNYPLGITGIVEGGDVPAVWTNTKFNMVYFNMSNDAAPTADFFQRRLFEDALLWVAKKPVPKRKATSANNDLPEMIKVEGGSFTMGDDNGDKDEKPAHQVSVPGFRIAKTETTNAQWKNFCLSTGRSMPEEPWFKQTDQHPVINVSYDHALAYCKWLSDVTGKHYRLPTEAEWEFAARGGVKSKGFPYSGGKNADSVAWLARKTDGTMPVAQKAPNELGLYDMTGNVWEWCSDWYGVEYYSTGEKDNPKGPSSGQFYTLRGGAWDIGLRNNRVGYRNPLAPMSRNHNKGFRVVCDE